MKKIAWTLLLLGLGMSSYALEAKQKVATAQSLKPGSYTAQVKAIVCDACGPKVQQTLEKVDRIEKVTVDQKNQTVQFTIKKDAKIKLADLQKTLKASSDEMGMGADYQLKNLKKAS